MEINTSIIFKVFILLYICYNLVHIFWSFGINPDNASIPILTSLGDLLASAFLLVVFIILGKLMTQTFKVQLEKVS
jgi:cation transporter-like permease